MKEIITILIILLGINYTNAQLKEKNFIYASNELTLGSSYLGYDLDLNYIFKEKYSFKVGFSKKFRFTETPENFGTINDILIFGPIDSFENYQITFGKIYKFNKSGTIRANLSFGLGSTQIRGYENFKLITLNDGSEYYTYNSRKNNSISFIINPKIEFPLTRFYGLTISPMVQISKFKPYFGSGIGHMFGLLRTKSNTQQSQ